MCKYIHSTAFEVPYFFFCSTYHRSNYLMTFNLHILHIFFNNTCQKMHYTFFFLKPDSAEVNCLKFRSLLHSLHHNAKTQCMEHYSFRKEGAFLRDIFGQFLSVTMMYSPHIVSCDCSCAFSTMAAPT